jgi:hypothetical protein
MTKPKVHARNYVVSGQPVSLLEIMEKLGVCDTTARSRLARVRAEPGPVTWEKLIAKARWPK